MFDVALFAMSAESSRLQRGRQQGMQRHFIERVESTDSLLSVQLRFAAGKSIGHRIGDVCDAPPDVSAPVHLL